MAEEKREKAEIDAKGTKGKTRGAPYIELEPRLNPIEGDGEKTRVAEGRLTMGQVLRTPK